MSLHTLKDVNGLADPLKQYQCTFSISRGIGTALSGGIIRKKDFELRCTSFTYPGSTVLKDELVIFNHIRRRGTTQDKSGVWKVSVTEDMNGSVLTSLQDWMDNIFNPATGIMMPSALYVAMASVDILGPDMKSTKRIYLRGLYPTKIEDIQVDPSSSKPVQVNVEFNYDWWSRDKLLGL
jgi:hypothetical protein